MFVHNVRELEPEHSEPETDIIDSLNIKMVNKHI